MCGSETERKDGRKGQNERIGEGKMSKEGEGKGEAKRGRESGRDYYILVLIASPVFI